MKQAIQIDERHVQGIFNLPCVISIHKNKRRFYVKVDTGDTLIQTAYCTNWLVEDENNKWHILTDEEYKSCQRRETK